jgi:hypothetical protein
MTNKNMGEQVPEICVILKEPGKEPRMEKIPNTLEALQEAVGGPIETVQMDVICPSLFSCFSACVICNESGRNMGLPYCCKVSGIDFCGTILLVGASEDEFADVPISLEVARQVFPELWETGDEGRGDPSSASEEAPSPEGEGKDGETDSHVQCEHWTQNDTGDEGRGSQSSVSEADSPFSKGPIACGRDEGRKEPESGKRLEDMTRMELVDYLADQLEKFPEMDVDLVKAAIREANRREAAEAVALADAIEDYKRKVNPGELMNITDTERLALMVRGLDISERIELRQAADLGVKALRLAGEITDLEAIHLLGQERVVEAMYEAIMRKRRE